MKQTKSTSMIVAVTAIVLAVMGLFLVYGNFNSKSINRISQAKVAHTATTTGSALEVNTQANSNVRYVKWGRIKVFKSKSTSSAVVERPRQDTKVKLLSKPDSNNWVKIKLPSGKKGYVRKGQLSKKDFPTRSLEYLKNEWAILEPLLEENGWEIIFDDGYEFYEGMWYRRNVRAKKESYWFHINSFARDGVRGRMYPLGYRWTLDKDGRLIDNCWGSNTNRNSVIEVITSY